MPVCPVQGGINFVPLFFTYTLASEKNHGKPQSVWPQKCQAQFFFSVNVATFLWAPFTGLLFPAVFSQGLRRLWPPLLKTTALQIARFQNGKKTVKTQLYLLAMRGWIT